MSEALKWLLIEGMVPMFGAGVIYLAMGVCVLIVEKKKGKRFTYPWKEALDPIGWLYGGAVLSTMIAVRSASPAVSAALQGFAICASAVCLLLLITAFRTKAEDPAWRPSALMSTASGILVAGTLYTGFLVQTDLFQEKSHEPRSAQADVASGAAEAGASGASHKVAASPPAGR
jgi:multisubunit Na+/H+ antiporter MnhB subunit